jgi:hypothetical protein
MSARPNWMRVWIGNHPQNLFSQNPSSSYDTANR